VAGSNVTIENSSFVNTSTPANGGAIFASFRGEVVVCCCSCFRNRSLLLILQSGESLSLNEVITRNSSASYGGLARCSFIFLIVINHMTTCLGAIYVSLNGYPSDPIKNVWLQINSSQFLESKAIFGGALFFISATSHPNADAVSNLATVTYSIFRFVYRAYFIQRSDTIKRDNWASLHGGAIACDGTAKLNLEGCSLEQNRAGQFGGGLYSTSTTSLAIRSVVFNSNEGKQSNHQICDDIEI